MATTISKHKQWSNSIKKRDKSCKKCGSIEKLVAHHKVSWTRCPHLRFDLNNGITLCDSCHKDFHNKYGNNQTDLLNLNEFLKNESETKVEIETEFDGLELTGEKFGRWNVLNKQIRSGKKYFLICKCDCGTIKPVNKCSLKNGRSKSCGCLHSEILFKRMSGKNNFSFTHGHSRKRNWSKEYRAWSDMKTRCTNPNARAYDLYGGRGIKVCESWMASYENFLSDMGEAPSKDFQLDRVDSNGDYNVNNCRWVSKKQQMRNVRNNRTITCQGETKTVIEWSELLGINSKTIYNRIYLGWDDEKCLMPTKRSIDGT